MVKLIRGGQTCNVWEARRDTDNERIAIKVLLGQHKSKKREIEQLRHEARVGSQMDHENVIKIFEFVDRYELPFITMQLFNARNLKLELRENWKYVAINVPGIIEKCILGLGHLHEKGWIHCDVKPDNFLVDEQGNVKLIDFSIAQPKKRKSAGLSSIFLGKKIQGTRSYMSPEQIRGKRLDATSDVYGFGCVMFELLAGRPPFSGSNPNELLHKHIRSAPPSLQAANKGVSDAFAALVLRTLSKDPADRPQTMSDLLQEVKSIQIYRAGKRPTSAN